MLLYNYIFFRYASFKEGYKINIATYENLISNTINSIITEIIEQSLCPNIPSTARAGAQISDYLEEKFYNFSINDDRYSYICNREKAPKDKTKNPWDAKCDFVINSINEPIWIDFKAIQVIRLDSNPDIGTPKKVIDFIKNGNFYLLYVYVYYESTDTGIRFVEVDSKYVKTYFLKDINHKFRRNPKNQLQVNVSAKEEKRSREEFIKLLCKKIKDSHIRQIEISEKALTEVSAIEQELLLCNSKSEKELIKKLESL